ncbi:IS66 family transposase [Eisenbergiella tayi]|uniref:IS66 family transposase n=3 Tax=Lachnospiraceae TaxID=186803 RepID=A0A6N7WD80_9FIRM|nr:IS66 family transposase [Eisenbergiella porci]
MIFSKSEWYFAFPCMYLLSINDRQYAYYNLTDHFCTAYENSNSAERRWIRPVVVGRKNWLFSDTVNGAEASMGIYMVVEMAKLHGLDPYKYMKYVLEQRPDYRSSDEDLEKLAPWSANVQEVCR